MQRATTYRLKKSWSSRPESECVFSLGTIAFIFFACVLAKMSGVSDDSQPQQQRALQPYVEEMQRRQSSTQHSSSFEKRGSCSLPLHLPGQEFALLSTSHAEMAPRCVDVNDPGIIFYGIFEDMDSLRDYVAAHEALHCGKVNVQAHPLREWGVLASSAERLADSSFVREHADGLLIAETDTQARHTAEFNENHSERKTGEGALEKALLVDSFSHKEKLRSLKKVSSLAVSVPPPYGQKFLVVSFVPDAVGGKFKEPLFKIYGTFESEEDADTWVRHVLSEHVMDVDIDVVACGQWLFPQSARGSDISKEVFRGGELNKIMQQHKSEPGRISSFEAWNARQQ